MSLHNTKLSSKELGVSRPKTGQKNIHNERASDFGTRIAPGSISSGMRPNTILNRNDTMLGQRRQTGAISTKYHGAFHKNKIEDELNKQLSVKARKKNENIEYNILQQIDKTYVLCIDPETRLPFMINMDLKMADICDLDNRPKHVKERQFLQA